ncbi:MAG: RagB/SusD family nutrient uptake outer membrane protein [Cyclobacteriaceae bacterium]|nr:MAG: RagB/SusD family nutrient uptake outer membrane protein [Cyclobacteriaceae bacterium]
MKKINKILFASFLLISFTACEEDLELTDPNNTGDAIALINDKNVKSTLVGAYNAISSGNLFGGNTFRNSELLAANDEIVFSGTFNDVADIYGKSIITANADVANLWIASYNTINVANNVLSALSVVNDSDQDQVEGEALFLRGVAHFELVLMYAKPYSAGNTTTNPGVPLMLTENRNSTDPIARASVQQVYDQIVADLTLAESLLAEGPSAEKATKEAAAAFLSRVYLQMGEYEDARDAANRALSTGNYSLRPTVASVFNGASTSEDLFDIPVSTVDGVNNMNTFYASATNGGRGDVEVLATHLNLYDASDARRNLFYIDTGTGDTRVGKWINRYGSVKVIRLAEMFLTRAECNQRLGTTVGDTPLNDVNTIRNRAGLIDLGAVTLGDILNERRLELAHEGQRLHDIKRLQGSLVQGATTYQFDDNKLVFPIPQREMDVNNLLNQNDGYSSN